MVDDKRTRRRTQVIPNLDVQGTCSSFHGLSLEAVYNDVYNDLIARAMQKLVSEQF